MNNTYEKVYHSTKIVTVSCYCVTFIVGIIGNGLVIWISGFRMKTTSAVWFLNLAIADFMFCLSLPLRIIDWLFLTPYFEYEVDFQDFLVFLNVPMLAINSIVSVTFLTVISVHRSVSIMWPMWAKVRLTRRLARIASVFLWIVPLACVALMIVISTVIENSVIFRFFFLFVPNIRDFSNMSKEYESHNYISLTLIINGLLTFGIPFIIILISNCLIIFKLLSNRFQKPKAFHRTFKLITAVVVCFFICWFPFNIWPLIALQVKTLPIIFDFIVSNLCLCLISISSCVNPILYVLLGHTHGAKSSKSIRARMENAINDFK